VFNINKASISHQWRQTKSHPQVFDLGKALKVWSTPLRQCVFWCTINYSLCWWRDCYLELGSRYQIEGCNRSQQIDTIHLHRWVSPREYSATSHFEKTVLTLCKCALAEKNKYLVGLLCAVRRDREASSGRVYSMPTSGYWQDRSGWSGTWAFKWIS
jgi:hypothetical protein